MNINQLDDHSLLQALKDLCTKESGVLAELLVHLGEVEVRQLHKAQACSSMHTYCVEVLGFSEYAAFERMKAARLVRQFPMALELVRRGELHLTGLTSLAPLLTPDTHEALLTEARRKTKREIELIVARLRPLPDVPDRVRREAPIKPLGPKLVPTPTPFMSLSPPAPPRAAPVEVRHAITFTASDHVKKKLDHARALASHRNPTQSLQGLFELALDALIEKLEKQREGAALRPRPQPPQAPHSRVVPRAIRREVYARDNSRCTFTAEGRQCAERAFLELHHIEAFALGGPTTTQNLTLLCRSHNAYEGHRVFGSSTGSGPRDSSLRTDSA